MELGRQNLHSAVGLAQAVGESTADYRARIALRQAEALEQRQRELAEQSSDVHAPAARIRMWERLHDRVLPQDPAHSVLWVIAASTGLSIEDVRAEQTNRRMPSVKGNP